MSEGADNGGKIGDPCEAIIAEFYYGPMTCKRASVTTATDRTWGTTHLVCGEHAPTAAASDE